MENDDCLLGLVPPFLWVVGGLDVGYLFCFSSTSQLSSPFSLLPLFLFLVLSWMKHDSAQGAQVCPGY